MKNNRVRKFVNSLDRFDTLCIGVSIGAAVMTTIAVKQLNGLDIIDINLIHDNVQNVDFLCVARKNGTYVNYLFEYTKK